MFKFAIRDDDTNYFTAPACLEAVYGEIWERVPVSLACVPFQLGAKQKNIPREYWDSGGLFPLGDNLTLRMFLSHQVAMGHLSIMQHGYSHWNKGSAYEFRDGDDLDRKAREGRHYLEDLLSVSVKVFVPPHNSIARVGFEAVVNAGLNIAGIPSFRPEVRHMRFSDIPSYLRFKLFAWRYLGTSFQYPWALRLSDHAEIGCYGLIPGMTFESLKAGLDFAYLHRGLFCLATHYWEILEHASLRNILLKLVDYACSLPEIYPVSVADLFEMP